MEGEDWIYSEKVKDHFMKPRNFLFGDESQFDADAVGQVGNPICGDQMKMYLQIKDDKQNCRRALEDLWLCVGDCIDVGFVGTRKRQDFGRGVGDFGKGH